ncbi:MurR/RpiR family transcriptional regulator [Chelativorans salis]|uniref:MurR/RpiR family transcriptional regulator n=1 Tax=Chelativorans salis TaxID=2978478 RepID=A0ABT2LX43_9HYPH|nr:MurR/RpiR family transcriptional regulator [Chelativorans sp. EGI FJ00035]MCT7378163.1 MurR/RpiR family transcriptional regulator [Chelativorans sp. EGI FJ00035]
MVRKNDAGEGSSSFLEMRSRIVARYPELSPQFQSIAQFALSNPEAMATETVVQLAGRVGAPPSSLVRFAQSLGYTGFAEMKRGFRDHLVFLVKTKNDSQGAPQGEGPADALRRLALEAQRDIEVLNRDFDATAFERAVNSLAGVTSIFVTAQHLSYPFASLFAWSLLEKGQECILLDNVGGFALRQSQLAGPKDATVSISFSPYQPSVVEEARAHRARGGTVIAITDTPLSPLAPHANEVLIVPGMAVGSTGSLAGALCLIRSLASAVAAIRGGNAGDSDRRGRKRRPNGGERRNG